MRARWLSVVWLFGVACAQRAPATAPAAAPAVARKQAQPEPPRREHPVTPARLMLLTDAIAAYDSWRFGKEPALPLAGSAVGYINANRTRSIATLSEVRQIDSPRNLMDLCVARDGKVTFVTAQGPEGPELLRGDSFDGPLIHVGKDPIVLGNGVLPQGKRWVVQGDSGSLLVECEAGTVERIGPNARRVSPLRWTDEIQLVRLYGATATAPTRCALRTRETGKWTELDDCYARSRADALIAIEKSPPETKKPPAKAQEPPRICLQLLDRDGKRLPCNTPVGPAVSAPTNNAEPRLPLTLARYFANSRACAPGPQSGLFYLDLGAPLSATNRLGSADLGYCKPLLATSPVFVCTDGRSEDVVVSVTPAGTLREELRRRRTAGERHQAPVFHTTNDGGVAIGGDCDGNLGNSACVRGSDGTWRTVAFSSELVRALSRTAPATRLVTNPEGQLYVGTATLRGGAQSWLSQDALDVSIVLFRADQGSKAAIPKLPSWILNELSQLTGASNINGTGVSFSSSRSVRAWPLTRQHPAFQSEEHCRIDITLGGDFETECVQGLLHSVGRMGLLQKRTGELYETLDAGGTWTRVALPAGFDSDEIACTALGCRLGPYFRAGWGEQSSPLTTEP